ncbi:PQQ-binding-like beta-propeller repeat protein [Nocardiopsis sp. RSe5-2]|uniref:PQQ-binding-like beta-propeller repeat protein n=1 Tax=Nocardiopsis endophytica TaxID=3018445 RepID=A0ABT4UAS5_9ACTN|nr:PQQ-binding-like beta-propeller repeat protein [Nocardiopsis endophytica]MDA2814035.1 PQQ-binding-like beta-propeller repeat protein [Nocardiopsis endophytica]
MTRFPGPRRAAAPAAGAAALLLLTACTGPEPREAADAVVRDDPPSPAPAVPAADIPPTLAPEAVWAAPFSAPPKAAGDGFVGPVMPEENGGDLVFLGVGPDGGTRWSLSRNPSCTAFAATRDADGRDLVVVLDSDADPDGGGLATRTTAAAYLPDEGTLVWGPVEVPGTLVGPGLVFGASAGSVMGGASGPKAALDPSTGAVAAHESEDGAGTILHEHQGALLTERNGRLRALDTTTGRELWNGTDLDPPDEAPGAAPAPGPRPETDAGAAAAVAWTEEGGGVVAYTVHDLRTGRRLAAFGSEEEPRLIGTPDGEVVVSGVSPDGRAAVAGIEAGTGDPKRLWRREAAPGDRTEAIVGGVLYLSTGNPGAEGTRAVDMRDGDTLGAGEWPAPVAAAPKGPVLLPVAPDGRGDAFAALPAAPQGDR